MLRFALRRSYSVWSALCLLAVTLHAQDTPMRVTWRRPDSQWQFVGGTFEERLRFAQVLGDSTVADDFVLRRLAGPMSGPRRSGAWLMDPDATVRWSSAFPSGINTGSLRPTRGIGVRFLPLGGAWRAGRWHGTVAPEILSFQNVEFPLGASPPVVAPFSVFAAPWNVSRATGTPYSIDLPWAYGRQPTSAIGLGQSSLFADLGPVEAGVTGDQEWWGPALRNALVLSTNAPGIPRLAIRSTRALPVPGGSLQFSYGLGQLSESPYFDAMRDNDRRSWNGAVVSFRFSAAPGLTIGAARSVYASLGAGSLSMRAMDVFRGVARSSLLPMPEIAAVPARDQIASVFARWVMPSDGLEVYAELGRAEAPGNIREFLLEPGHSGGWTLGFQRISPLAAQRWWRIGGEMTFAEQGPSISSIPHQTSWYTSRAVRQGYTHRGQVIGAGLGPGSSGQYLALDWIGPTWTAGVFASRMRWNQDAFYTLPWNYPSQGWCEWDVTTEFGGRISAATPFGVVQATLARARRLNMYYQKTDGCPGNGTSSPRDVPNTLLFFSVSPASARVVPSAGARRTAGVIPSLPEAPRTLQHWTEGAVGSEAELWWRARSLVDTAWHHPWSLRGLSQRQVDGISGRVRAGRTFEFALVRSEIGARYNSQFPFGMYDGAVWAGRGTTLWLTGGLALRIGPFSMRLAPLGFRSENRAFPLIPNGLDGRETFADPIKPRSVDAPQRFGATPYSRLDLGTSSAQVELLGLAIGATAAPQWWGPASFFPFLFSNQGPGIPRIFAGTSAPLAVGPLLVTGQLQWGDLRASEVFMPDTVPTRRRFGTGVIAVVQPRAMPTLEVGAARYFHARWPQGAIPVRYWTRSLEGVLKRSLPVVSGPNALDDRSRDAENQLASAFARWAFPSAGFEVYGELGREDHSWDLRDLVVSPAQQSSRMVGFAHVSGVSAKGALMVRGEHMSFRALPNDLIRGTGMTYRHSGTLEGHTLRGQNLGAPLGVGSSEGTTVRVDWLRGSERLSVGLLRALRYQLLSPATPDPSRLDVQYIASAERAAFGGRPHAMGAAVVWNLNRNWQRDVVSASLWYSVTLGR
jgi:hypothetical protein